MGYCIEMTNSKFIVKKENLKKALDSLKSVFVPELMTTYNYVNGAKYPHFRWVTTKTVLESKSFGEALREIRYEPIYNTDGDIINVEFQGEKYGDEAIFFNAIALYVESGSFLDFEGEDGATWTWIFKDGEVINVSNEC